MKKEKIREGKSGNALLLGILGFLCVVIVGLGIGVVATFVLKGKEAEEISPADDSVWDNRNVEIGEDGQVDWETVPDDIGLTGEEQEQISEDFEIINEINYEIYPMSLEDCMSYLDNKLEEYKGTSLEFRIRMIKVWVYVNKDMPTEAKEVFDEIDENTLSEHEKVDYLDAKWQIYDKLGDSESSTAYNQEYQKQYYKVWGKGEWD